MHVIMAKTKGDYSQTNHVHLIMSIRQREWKGLGNITDDDHAK